MESALTGLDIGKDASYVLLLVSLFVIPRILIRWKIPAAITAFALGAAVSLGFGWFAGDPTVNLLSTLGIVALFLFAGLEVDFAELRRGAGILAQHVLVRLFVIGGLSVAAHQWLSVEWRPAVLVALALATPSTGFILDSLDALGSTPEERFWIRSKAIAVEMVALAILFVDLRSNSWQDLTVSSLALVALVGLLPVAFGIFTRWVLPLAPKSDFAFLMILAVICAVVTKQLGVYYLVGAFIVGLAAHRFREKIPSMRDDRMLHAVEALSSLFIPFYFFHAGLELRRDDFSMDALLLGLIFVALVLPLRLLVVGLHRRVVFKESLAARLRISIPMLPTLVFTLVIAQILREQFAIDPVIYGALVIYAVINTMLPSMILRSPPPAFENVTAPSLHVHEAAADIDAGASRAADNSASTGKSSA